MWIRPLDRFRFVVILFREEKKILKDQVAQMQSSLESQVAHLHAESEKLRDRINKASHNLAKLPSSDAPQMRIYPKPESSGEKKVNEKDIMGMGGSQNH